MRKRTIALVAILAALLAACTEKSGCNRILVQADSLMASRPDSALHILEGISTESLDTKADRAYHALLLTQARDKNYMVQTDDSLIRTAVQYYDSTKESHKQAKAYYYWGSFYRDKNDYSQAIDKYAIALAHTNDHPENAELKASLYSNLGYLYYTQSLNHEADSIYQQAELLAVSQKDTVSLCYALSQRGMISLEQGRKCYPKAEQQMLQALSVGKAFSDSTILIPIYHSLSMLYSLMPKPRQALQYARLNYACLKDTLHCYRTFLLLGNACFLNGQYDSADIFLQKVLKAERYYDTKADACMLLSEMAQKRGDMETSILLERKRTKYQDSARINQQGHGILNTVIARERNNSKTIAKRSTHVIYAISVILIAVSIFYIFHFFRHKAEKKEWEEKERENATLQEKAGRLAVKQQMRKELEKLNEQHIILLKKTLEYSDVYNKMQRIISNCKEHGTSKESLTDDEWNRFLAETDPKGVINRISEMYGLSEIEFHLCILLLLDYSVTDMGRIIQRKRMSVYRIERSISKKMGRNYQAGELQKLLKNMLNDNMDR